MVYSRLMYLINKLDDLKVTEDESMRYGHSLGAMVVYKENPIILGGLDKSNNSVSGVEIYLQYWASQDDLPQPVHLHSALVANYEVLSALAPSGVCHTLFRQYAYLEAFVMENQAMLIYGIMDMDGNMAEKWIDLDMATLHLHRYNIY